MFAGIQRYMDETEMLPMAASVEIVQKLLHQGLKRPELKDELFMQLLKQSRGNPSPHAAGVLMSADASLLKPADCFIKYQADS